MVIKTWQRLVTSAGPDFNHFRSQKSHEFLSQQDLNVDCCLKSAKSGIVGSFRISCFGSSDLTQIQILLSTPGSPSADSFWVCHKSERRMKVSNIPGMFPCVSYLVGWQVQLVKAGVGCWQPAMRENKIFLETWALSNSPVSGPVVPVNLELLNSVHSLQSPKSLGREGWH